MQLATSNEHGYVNSSVTSLLAIMQSCILRLHSDIMKTNLLHAKHHACSKKVLLIGLLVTYLNSDKRISKHKMTSAIC